MVLCRCPSRSPHLLLPLTAPGPGPSPFASPGPFASPVPGPSGGGCGWVGSGKRAAVCLRGSWELRTTDATYESSRVT